MKGPKREFFKVIDYLLIFGAVGQVSWGLVKAEEDQGVSLSPMKALTLGCRSWRVRMPRKLASSRLVCFPLGPNSLDYSPSNQNKYVGQAN